jgi:basic amino acid/polyamine antiporter, APA family
MSQLAPGNVTLIRGLGLISAVAIVIGNVIGTGVFLKTRVMVCNVGTPGNVLAVWVAAGLLSLAGALTYAEIATLWPRAGGEYVFLREAYGARFGFLYGWMQFFIARAGGLAAMSVAFAIFLNVLTNNRLGAAYFTWRLWGDDFSFGNLQVVALSCIAVVTLINCAAVRVSGAVAALLTGIKIAVVLFIGIGAFLYTGGDWLHLWMTSAGGLCEEVPEAMRGGFGGFGAAMLAALWAYNGWNDLTFVGGEVKNPQRNIPLALIGGMILVGLLYIFINVAYFYVLTPAEIASVSAKSSVATEAALRFLGPLAASLIAAALMASSFGTLHVGVLASGRLPYAMARDRLFFQGFAHLNRHTHTPIRALVAQSVWAGALALTGSFDALTDYSIFGLWIFYALATGTVFIFRRRLPDAERPYRTWGYPVVPVLFLIVAGWLLVNTLITAPSRSVTGIILILLGLPVYEYLVRRNRVESEKQEAPPSMKDD